MELLVSLVKDGLHTAAERAASYRLGQSALRYMDRALWIVEKSARWAVPPPLDQDELPQPELVRPLPWVFFLALLIMLRITRESISLVNLALGKPPLRSADVVTYIQSKRRYLRTLKYQGNRMMRARSERITRESWYSQLQSMFEFTMCFRRQHYGNNNTRLINGDEVLVVKRSKKIRQEASTVASTSETSMERLIEKMMVDVDAESDESGYTLTNLTSGRSDRSDFNSESDQETGSNTKTQVKHSQDSKTVKETKENTSLTDANTKTPVNQSQINKTVKRTQNNTSASDTERSDTVNQGQDNTSLPASLNAADTKIPVKQSQDSKTVKETQDNNNSLIAPDTKSPIIQSQDNKKAKQIQENTNTSHTASNAETPVIQSQDNDTGKVKTSQVDKTGKQTEEISAKENNVATSTPKKGYKENSIDFYQSNDSMMRLDGEGDIQQERDVKEATIDFMQNEIGSHGSEGYNPYKIANGLMSTDLTATES